MKRAGFTGKRRRRRSNRQDRAGCASRGEDRLGRPGACQASDKADDERDVHGAGQGEEQGQDLGRAHASPIAHLGARRGSPAGGWARSWLFRAGVP